MTDYLQVLRIIDHASDPVTALQAFVSQEVETGQYDVQKRTEAAIFDFLDGIPTYGPPGGTVMLDISLDEFKSIMETVRQALYGIERPLATRKRAE